MLNIEDNVKAIINLDNLKSNVRTIINMLSPGSQLIAVVKADGYGHGAVKVSEAAVSAGASMLAVATTTEAENLRNNGIETPILVLSRCMDAEKICKYNLIPSVSSYEFAEFLNETAKKSSVTIDIHIKVNTGMSRLGFSAETSDSVDAVEKINRLSNLRITGIFSHFAVSDVNDGKDFTEKQFSSFEMFVKKLSDRGVNIPLKHICNSGGTFSFPHMHLDSVRCGIAMYGCAPDEKGMDYGLLPVMELKSRILHIRELTEGETVSYGRTFRADDNIRVAIVSCGYADGYHRLLSGKADVLIRGKRAPVIGRVCMDVFMADVTHIEDACPADVVTILGKDGNEIITADELAERAGTISYEILTSVSQRVERKYF